jgi:membrane protein
MQIILMGAEVTHAYANRKGSLKRRESNNAGANAPLSKPGGSSGKRAKRAS